MKYQNQQVLSATHIATFSTDKWTMEFNISCPFFFPAKEAWECHSEAFKACTGTTVSSSKTYHCCSSCLFTSLTHFWHAKCENAREGVNLTLLREAGSQQTHHWSWTPDTPGLSLSQIQGKGGGTVTARPLDCLILSIKEDLWLRSGQQSNFDAGCEQLWGSCDSFQCLS